MNIFELFGSIAIKNRDANNALDDTAQRAERTGDRMRKTFKDIGAASLKIGKTVIGSAAAIGTAFVAAVESTRNYRSEMAKLSTAFLSNGFSAETATQTYKALQAVLGETDQAVEAANHLALLTDNEADLVKWTDICTGVYATFGASLPIEGLTESANETAKVGTVTGTLADALNWAGISEDDFNKKLSACTTAQERQDLIMNTLYWTYKNASDQYKETGESVMKANAAQDNLNAALAKLGEIGEPILTGLKNWAAGMITAVAPGLESIVKAFSNLGETMEKEVWPQIQKDVKATFGIDLPDWPTVKANFAAGWETVKTEIANSLIINFLVHLPENWEKIAQDIATGWDTKVKPAIQNFFEATFGVDMPTWEDIASNIASGWDDVIVPAIQNFFKVTFGVDMPSWSDITSSIQAGWQSVLNSVAGLFNIDVGYNVGSFGGGESEGNGAGRSFAGGLDRVPNDGYIARLHKDEAVLKKADADVWRGGGSARIEALLAQMVALMSAGQSITLDSGILAGQLAPAIDAQLGTIQGRKGRRG